MQKTRDPIAAMMDYILRECRCKFCFLSCKGFFFGREARRLDPGENYLWGCGLSTEDDWRREERLKADWWEENYADWSTEPLTKPDRDSCLGRDWLPMVSGIYGGFVCSLLLRTTQQKSGADAIPLLAPCRINWRFTILIRYHQDGWQLILSGRIPLAAQLASSVLYPGTAPAFAPSMRHCLAAPPARNASWQTAVTTTTNSSHSL